MPPDTPCPSAEFLRRSLDPDDPMPAAERQRIEAHVDRCTRGCKKAIDVLLRGNTLLVGPATADPVNAPAAVASDCPARLGRYRIVGKLGSGGFGTVYRGYDDELRRDVAVKAPHRHRIATPEDAEAYLAEARTVAGLDHPHIVPVFDLGRADDGLCFVVSRFIEGGDLVQRISAGRPSFAESAALAAAVAEALHHAHKRGLVHRDVKPGNILIDHSGTPFLTDFGLALAEEDYGKGGGLAGTPAYMSPEQASGEGHRVDGRSDIFSLGVVLYELLTGRRPFRADSVRDMLDQIAGVEARPPRQIDDAIPKELERICLKALSKRASDRYTTARDMADDLRHFLAGMARELKSMLAEGRVSGAAMAPALPTSAPTTASDSRPFKVVPKGLRSFDAHDADFFLELLPGPRDRGGLPDSLRFWKTRIETTEAHDTFPVGLIYGPSGCGKSSLVKAGLLPRLAKAVTPVYLEATADETEAQLLKGLGRQVPDLPKNIGLIAALAALRQGRSLESGQKVLLVLDQFEQWLHARHNEENADLVQALRQCDGGRVQCVVMVRDDFWMPATRFMAKLEISLVQGQNCAAVDLFDLLHARKVLAAFGRAYGRLPDCSGPCSKEQGAFLDQAVAGLAQDGKVIPVRLALFAEMVKGRPWTPAALKEVGGAEGVGVAFLEETFTASTAPPQHRLHQKAAQAVLKSLSPESGTDIKGHMRSQQALLEASGYTHRPRDFDELLRILDSEIRLITPTDPEAKEEAPASPVTGGERFYQLTHDYLVPALRDWLTRKQKETRRGRAELLLADRSAVWNARPESRQLPSLWQWLQIRWLTPRRNWTPPQKRMMRRATGHHAARVLAVVVFLVLVGLGAYEGYGRLKAQALRDRLLNANTTDVPLVVSDMAPYRRWTDPLLREAYQEAEATRDARKQLHASLALLPADPGQVDYLYGRLLDADPQEVSVLVQGLSSHKGELIERLWAVVQQPEQRREGRGLRAAAALAAYDAGGERWDGAGGPVTEQLVQVNPAFLAAWMEAFRPARQQLLVALAAAFRDRQQDRTSERNLAASILADYAADRPGLLAELVMDADEKQFAILRPMLERNSKEAQMALTMDLLNIAPAQEKEADRIAGARRQANAAATLVALGAPDAAWPLLKHSRTPDARTVLIHGLAPRGADPRVLIRRLEEEKDASIRAALILALGEYTAEQLPPEGRAALTPKLMAWYRNDPDPGVHGAIDWLLRHAKEGPVDRPLDWGGQRDLEKIDAELAGKTGPAGQRWYVNGQAQTLTAVRGPVEFIMGSPEDEPGRADDEILHRRTIGRSFAVAARPVTVAQWEKFLEAMKKAKVEVGHEYTKKYAPEPDCPIISVTWYEAAMYCRWLSEVEQAPEKQMVYPPIEDILKCADGQTPLKLAPDYLSRTGYRLPTEAEFEYACRAGTGTRWSFGGAEEFLARHAWFVKNSEDRTWPAGQKKPNELGLFDVHGNVWTWCQDGYPHYGAADSEDMEENRDVQGSMSRVLRGGSFFSVPRELHSAYCRRYTPATRRENNGFRAARTLPRDHFAVLPPE